MRQIKHATVNIRMTEDLRQTLIDTAKECGTSYGWLARRFIHEGCTSVRGDKDLQNELRSQARF